MLFRLLLLAFFIPLISCSDDDDSSGGNSDGDSFFEVTIDGEKFRSEGDAVAFGENSTGGTGNQYAVYGTDDPLDTNPRRIFIVLPEKDGPGTYDLSLGADGLGNFLQGQVSLITIFGEGEGSLTISEQTSERTKGTFNFTAFNADGTESKSFTNGSFDVKFN